MSDTPRTDREIKRIKRSNTLPGRPVGSEFARQLEHENRELLAALKSLAEAADAYVADQAHATHPGVGLVQPVSVEECEALNQAVQASRELISKAEGGYQVSDAPKPKPGSREAGEHGCICPIHGEKGEEHEP